MASFNGISAPLLSSYEYKFLNSLRESIQKITKSQSGFNEIKNSHYLNGVFKKLCDDKLLIENLFPGTSADVLVGLPKNLREVVQWNELGLDAIKIAKKAAVVLSNIKEKGAKRGDIMDEQTENVLLPQIALEALANEIIDAVRNLNRRVSSTMAKHTLAVASTTAPQATLDQLDDEVIQSLNSEQQHAIQLEYLGEEWTALAIKDIQRYCRDENLTEINKYGSTAGNVNDASDGDVIPSYMAFLGPNAQLKATYPALAEVIGNLHSLPYELNYKFEGKGVSHSYLEPAKGSTMLIHYPVGSSQLPRVDSYDDGGSLDSGIRLSCSYHLFNKEEEGSESINSSSSSQGNSLILTKRSNDALVSRNTLVNDMLIIHQSAVLKNERPKVTQEYYVLVYFIHGKVIVA